MEFNLSDELEWAWTKLRGKDKESIECIEVHAVQEFIKRLKEEIDESNRDKIRVCYLHGIIDKLAGERFNGI